jgi:hypothetical protein
MRRESTVSRGEYKGCAYASAESESKVEWKADGPSQCIFTVWSIMPTNSIFFIFLSPSLSKVVDPVGRDMAVAWRSRQSLYALVYS